MKRTPGFTLVELLVAMALGLTLMLIALVAIRTVAQTVAQANRMSLQNKMMRQGVLEALDELDFWTRYDDPLDATKQGLRTITTMPAAAATAKISDGLSGPAVTPGDGVTTQPSSTSKLRLGLPFSPLAGFPMPLTNDFGATTEGGQPVARRIRPVVAASTDYTTMLLAPVTALRDDSGQSAGQAYDLDRDRGYDPLRPYQANDPRRWYRGNIYESPHSDKRFGRYAMLMNLWQKPMLGYGSDPREIMSFGRSDPWTDARPPGYQAVTGPYGPYPAGNYSVHGMSSRTWTWYSNQVVYLWEALGNYGLAEYLPSGTIISSYGARAYHPLPTAGGPEYPEPYLSGISDPLGPTIRLTVRDPSRPDDNYMRIDERQDFRFGGYPSFVGYSGTNQRSQLINSRVGSHTGKPGTVASATVDATHPLLPISDNTGFRFVGMPWEWGGWDNLVGDDARNQEPNNTLPVPLQQIYHRMAWAGPRSGPSTMRPLENRSQLVMPLMPLRPPTWPDITLVVQRLMFAGRFTAIVRVRWSDPVTTEVAELGVTAIATTLRGARMQRRPTSGWATFYGVNDPRNDLTLDSPSP